MHLPPILFLALLLLTFPPSLALPTDAGGAVPSWRSSGASPPTAPRDTNPDEARSDAADNDPVMHAPVPALAFIERPEPLAAAAAPPAAARPNLPAGIPHPPGAAAAKPPRVPSAPLADAAAPLEAYGILRDSRQAARLSARRADAARRARDAEASREASRARLEELAAERRADAARPAVPAPPAPRVSPSPAPHAHEALVGPHAFSDAVAGSGLAFVKFFSPRCPHCRAMARAFADLSLRIASDRARTPVAVFEVDCTNYANRPVCDEHVPAGYPTLKLFKSGALVSEYGGARDEASMFAWIGRAVAFDKAPLVAHISSLEELYALVATLQDHALILAVKRPGVRKALQDEWDATAVAMRERSATNVAFATVSDWRLLLGRPDSALARSFGRANRYGVPPYAVGGPDASRMFAGMSVVLPARNWFFDGVAGADSLDTFMHLATLPTGGKAALTPENAVYVTATSSVLALVFDHGNGPTWAMEEMLETLAKEREAVPLYVSSRLMAPFKRHVGFPAPLPTVPVSQYGKLDLALYRAPGSGVERLIFNGTDHSVEAMSLFLHSYLDWGVNMTKMATGPAPPAIAPAVPLKILADGIGDPSGGGGGLAPELKLDSVPVLVVTASTWWRRVGRDGRTALLLLYDADCGACQAFLPIFDEVSSALAGDVTSVFAARMDIAANELPGYIERPKKVPTVLALVPSYDPVAYTGEHVVGDIVAFARFHASPGHIKATASHSGAGAGGVPPVYNAVVGRERIAEIAAVIESTAGNDRSFARRELILTFTTAACFALGLLALGVGVVLEFSTKSKRCRKTRYDNGAPSATNGNGLPVEFCGLAGNEFGELKVQ